MYTYRHSIYGIQVERRNRQRSYGKQALCDPVNGENYKRRRTEEPLKMNVNEKERRILKQM